MQLLIGKTTKLEETKHRPGQVPGTMTSVAVNGPPVEKLTLKDSSNTGQRWEKWKKSLNILMTATGVTVDGQKRALLLHLGGPEVLDIF